MIVKTDYYVYLYLRQDLTPYYVGKGRRDRAWRADNRNYGNVIKVPEDEDLIVFHSINLNEEQAYLIESELICKYGRKDKGTGCLENLTDGGKSSKGVIVKKTSIYKRLKSSAMNRKQKMIRDVLTKRAETLTVEKVYQGTLVDFLDDFNTVAEKQQS